MHLPLQRVKRALAIVRLSGKDAHAIAHQITHKPLTPRKAHYTNFYDCDDGVIDQGSCDLFPKPGFFYRRRGY